MEPTTGSKILSKLGWWNWMVTIAEAVMGAGIAVVYLRQLPPQIPLFYGRPWGEGQLASPAAIVIPLVVGLGMGMIEIGIMKFIKKDPVLGIIILASGLTAQIILGAAVLRILWLVI